jgi:hypothetical protein
MSALSCRKPPGQLRRRLRRERPDIYEQNSADRDEPAGGEHSGLRADREQAGSDRRPAERGRRLQHACGRVRARQLVGSTSHPGQQGGLHLAEDAAEAALQPDQHDDEKPLPATGHRGSGRAKQ